MYKWIFFDADNTLFDFTASSALAFEAMVDKLSIPRVDNLYSVYMKHNSSVWHLFEEGKISSVDLRSRRFDLFFQEIDFVYDGLKANDLYLQLLVDNVRLIDGAVELLEHLRSKAVKMLIITNGLKEVQKPRLAQVELTHFFKDIIVSDEIGIAKPDKGFFKYAEVAAGTPPREQVLVIGDSLTSDILGGNLYGYDTCWYNPHVKSNATDIKPTYEIQNLASIYELI